MKNINTLKYLKRFLPYKILLVVTLVLLLAVVMLVYLVFRPEPDPQAKADAEREKVVAEVSELLLLPTDETPSLATVQDQSLLQDQKFFENAQNQDQLLIYPKAGKAILYRPSVQKIVNVGPLVFESSSNEANAGLTESSEVDTETASFDVSESDIDAAASTLEDDDDN